ncbi:MAG: hypothetical protein H6Q89_452 [Myxococcaceae bacterium]|nr:hypothetical protein [Myxococcaceae bacterium]
MDGAHPILAAPMGTTDFVRNFTGFRFGRSW